MKNEIYDFLKRIALVVLPALATLVITIFQIWNIPYGEQIGATITAIDMALGVILGISSKNYYRNLKRNKN
ncbi:MAG: phage holin [Bacilli bacterium]|nr:phage holin [Bacilli bacterium]